jgi:hypothetical protein
LISFPATLNLTIYILKPIMVCLEMRHLAVYEESQEE